MGLPTKCMHFVGSPGRRGYNTPMSGGVIHYELDFMLISPTKRKQNKHQVEKENRNGDIFLTDARVSFILYEK